MEKTLFISTLKEKSGVDNLSERTIEEVATMYLPQFTDDEKITDESWAVPVQVLKSMSGQLRHDLSGGISDFKNRYEAEQKTAQEKAIADAVAAAKAEWEKSKGGAPADGNDDTKSMDEKIAAAVANAISGLTGDEGAIGKLSKQFGDFVSRIEAEKKAQTEESVRASVRDYLLSRGADEDDFALDYTLEKLAIGDKPDISALNAKAEKDYEANYKKIHKNAGARPFAGGSGSGDQESGAKKWLDERDGKTKTEAEAAEARRKLLK